MVKHQSGTELPAAQLRGYQQDAVSAIVGGFASGGRVQVPAACGTGKTLVALHAAVRLCPPGGLVVVTCSSLALVAQTLEVWARRQVIDRVLAVCSDPTVGDAPMRTGDLPCPVTLRPAEIAGWLRQPSRARRLKGKRIVGAERQALAKDLGRRFLEGASIHALALSVGRSYGFVHRVWLSPGLPCVHVAAEEAAAIISRRWALSTSAS